MKLPEDFKQKIEPKINDRCAELIAKRQAETLTYQEHNELLQLTNEVEGLEVKRIECLSQLAKLRDTSLIDLMKDLGIQFSF